MERKKRGSTPFDWKNWAKKPKVEKKDAEG